MLAIRMQRTGRKGHAMFRVVVQDSRVTPTSGKVVAQLGSYDPHAKTASVDKEKATFYLSHGAQPSQRVARLLQLEGVKLPEWVAISENKTGKLRNSEKLRKNQPKEEKPVEAAPAPSAKTEETPTEEKA
jgi:small subunit ribosomal protein S16